MVAVVVPNVHTALVVGVPSADVAEGVVLRESFRQVHSVTVDVVFFNPVVENTLCEGTYHRRFVVVVVSDIEVVRW